VHFEEVWILLLPELQQKQPLFDYLVGGGEHCLWECKTERFGRLQIND
jgi:hypothetical protein